MKYPPEILLIFLNYTMYPGKEDTYLYVEFSPKITLGFKNNNTISLVYKEVTHDSFFKSTSILKGLDVNDKINMIFLKKIVSYYEDLRLKMYNKPGNKALNDEMKELKCIFDDLKTFIRNEKINDILK